MSGIRVNATHSGRFLHRKRVLAARARASTRLERATDTPPRCLLPSLIPRCMLGRQVYYRLEKMADVQPPPLRTLDDFLLSSARFAVPDVRDLDRWNNRIINNLLYYQSNYFLSALGLLLIVG